MKPLNNWSKNPKRALAVRLIDMAHSHDRSARGGKNHTAQIIAQAAECRAMARRLTAEAEREEHG